MIPPCDRCGATYVQRTCTHDSRGALGVDVKDLRQLCDEIEHLRRQVTELQEKSTKLVLERRTSLRSRVREFHAVMGQDIAERPGVPTEAIVRHRARLIAEEFFEVIAALFGSDWCCSYATRNVPLDLGYAIEDMPVKIDLVELADALGDLDYVVEGSRISFGIDGEPVMAAIHAANMQKTPSHDVAKKITKPPGWQAPDICAVLIAQGWTPPEEEFTGHGPVPADCGERGGSPMVPPTGFK